MCPQPHGTPEGRRDAPAAATGLRAQGGGTGAGLTGGRRRRARRGHPPPHTRKNSRTAPHRAQNGSSGLEIPLPYYLTAERPYGAGHTGLQTETPQSMLFTYTNVHYRFVNEGAHCKHRRGGAKEQTDRPSTAANPAAERRLKASGAQRGAQGGRANGGAPSHGKAGRPLIYPSPTQYSHGCRLQHHRPIALSSRSAQSALW